MNRRTLILALPGAALWATTAHAQHTDRVFRIGVIGAPDTGVGGYRQFLDELRVNGFTEGQNLVVEKRQSPRARPNSAQSRRRHRRLAWRCARSMCAIPARSNMLLRRSRAIPTAVLS